MQNTKIIQNLERSVRPGRVGRGSSAAKHPKESKELTKIYRSRSTGVIRKFFAVKIFTPFRIHNDYNNDKGENRKVQYKRKFNRVCRIEYNKPNIKKMYVSTWVDMYLF